MKFQRVIVLLFFLIFEIGFSQGKLEKAKESLKKEKSSGTSTTRRATSSGSEKRDLEGSFFGEILAELVYEFTLGLVYAVAIETAWESKSKMYDAEFSNYPYEKNNAGDYLFNVTDTNYKLWRVDVANNFVYESENLFGNNFKTRVGFLRRFSGELEYTHLFERVENGFVDSFVLYSGMLNYHRIRTERLNLWYGLGLAYVGNNVQKTGFSLGAGAEWFIVKPISLLASIRGTSINDKPVNKSTFLLKYHTKNYNVSVGNERFKLGTQRINAFSFGLGMAL